MARARPASSTTEPRTPGSAAPTVETKVPHVHVFGATQTFSVPAWQVLARHLGSAQSAPALQSLSSPWVQIWGRVGVQRAEPRAVPPALPRAVPPALPPALPPGVPPALPPAVPPALPPA